MCMHFQIVDSLELQTIVIAINNFQIKAKCLPIDFNVCITSF